MLQQGTDFKTYAKRTVPAAYFCLLIKLPQTADTPSYLSKHVGFLRSTLAVILRPYQKD